MATTPRQRLDRELWHIKAMPFIAGWPTATRDALLRFADTLDKSNPRETATDADGNAYAHEPRTVEAYVRCLRLLYDAGVDVLDCTADDVNAQLDAWHDDGDGKSASTLNGYQAAARAFYRVFDGLCVDATAIAGYVPDRTPRHDAADILTEDEVWALREAAGRTRHPTRDRAMLELLVYTGQRIRALATLKVDDVRPEEPAIYLNPDVDGLKGALRRGRRRPMFGAKKYVKDWLDARKAKATNDWCFVGDPNHWRTDPDDHWAEVSIDHVFRRLAEDAGVDKDISAHSMRHYTVTVLRRDYERSPEEINALLGVVEGSNIWQTTYNHIDNDRLMRNIEVAMGYAEDESPNRFAPPVCVICDEVLKPNWKRCPACDHEYGPDAGQSIEEWTADRQAFGEDRLQAIVERKVDKALAELGHD